MPQPVRAFTDGSGSWLVLDNGHRIQLPTGEGSSASAFVLKSGDTMTGSLQLSVPRTYGVMFTETETGEQRVVGMRTTTSGVAGLGVFKPGFDPAQPLQLQPFGVADPSQPEHAVSRGYLDAGRQTTITPVDPFADYTAPYAGLWATGVGPIVTIEGLVKVTGSTAITAGVPYPVLTIPAGWRPDHDIIVASLLAPAGGATFAPVRLTVAASNGVLSMVSPTAQTFATAGWLPVGCTYRST